MSIKIGKLHALPVVVPKKRLSSGKTSNAGNANSIIIGRARAVNLQNAVAIGLSAGHAALGMRGENIARIPLLRMAAAATKLSLGADGLVVRLQRGAIKVIKANKPKMKA